MTVTITKNTLDLVTKANLNDKRSIETHFDNEKEHITLTEQGANNLIQVLDFIISNLEFEKVLRKEI